MRDTIKLVSTASSYYYTITKNKKTKPGKMKVRKYDPITRKHEDFEEAKIK
ncbi:MAG: 50S ribosomal protein L33 [Gammaproteobacteria bacterium]|nr:50S ribosomal protein L33 [Gammaproteobacteria bacterium]